MSWLRRHFRFNTHSGGSSGRGGYRAPPRAVPEGEEVGEGVVAYNRRSVKPGPGVPRQDFESIRAECVESGTLWEDPEFPASNESLSKEPGYSEANNIEWLRPSDFCDDPQFMTDGASRFDVVQGRLGDCWLLAAVASLTLHKRLLDKVVHTEQNFSDDYAGIFRFTFWHQGEWLDVCVDDRLPVSDGVLVYMQSQSQNELWTALLEKAYAKLCGSYENLRGGHQLEAMEDFSGGVGENFRLAEAEDLFKLMLKAKHMGSLKGCAIEADPSRLEAQLDNGLVMGHAYSVTDVALVDIEHEEIAGQLPMVRIRNPWGTAEWNGPWSDQSHEWSLLSDEEKEELGLQLSDNGEFWMTWQDFSDNFTKMEVCNLGPDTLCEEDEEAGTKHFNAHALHGAWIRRVNAGGCRNFLDTFWTNPQFRVTLTDPDDDEDDLCTLIVALMQKDRRKLRTEGKDMLAIGYVIYHLEDPEAHAGPLDLEFYKYNSSVAKSPSYTNTREVCGRHRLPAGTYVIVPSTFDPNEEADFLLRIFTERATDSAELDDETGLSEERPETPEPTEEDEEQGSALKENFERLAGSDGEIDSKELCEILNIAFKDDADPDGFSRETSRSMISLMDADRTGMLGFDEFIKLWNKLRKWKTVFVEYDKDQSGQLSTYELRAAMKQLGFRMSNETLTTLVLRFSGRDGLLAFDEFVLCIVKLGHMIDLFYDNETSENEAKFTLDEFIHSTMYS